MNVLRWVEMPRASIWCKFIPASITHNKHIRYIYTHYWSWNLVFLVSPGNNTKALCSFTGEACLSLFQLFPQALWINNPTCSAVPVPCTAPLTTVTNPVHSASGSNSTYPTSGYSGSTWTHVEPIKSSARWKFHDFDSKGMQMTHTIIMQCNDNCMRPLWHHTGMQGVLKSGASNIHRHAERHALLLFLFCFLNRRRLNSKQYLGGAWSSNVGFFVIDVTSNGRCTDVRWQDEALLGETVSLTAHWGKNLSRCSSKQSSRGAQLMVHTCLQPGCTLWPDRTLSASGDSLSCKCNSTFGPVAGTSPLPVLPVPAITQCTAKSVGRGKTQTVCWAPLL